MGVGLAHEETPPVDDGCGVGWVCGPQGDLRSDIQKGYTKERRTSAYLASTTSGAMAEMRILRQREYSARLSLSKVSGLPPVHPAQEKSDGGRCIPRQE